MKKQKGIGQFFKPCAKATSTEFNEISTSSNTESSSVATLTDNQAPCESNSSGLFDRPFCPEGSFIFPTVTTAQNQTRSCQHKWFDKYAWLDYNIAKDSVTCFVCRKQNLKENLVAERCKEDVFLEKGFRNWKKH